MDRLNPLVVRVLRSPLHWLLSPGLTLLTITGKRSGRTYSIPVGYHDVGDAIVVMVSDAASRSWWRNFRTPHPVELTHRGRPLRARGELLRPESEEFRRRAEQAFGRARFIGRIFGIDFDRRAGLTPEQVRALGSYAAIVRLTPEPVGADP